MYTLNLNRQKRLLLKKKQIQNSVILNKKLTELPPIQPYTFDCLQFVFVKVVINVTTLYATAPFITYHSVSVILTPTKC